MVAGSRGRSFDRAADLNSARAPGGEPLLTLPNPSHDRPDRRAVAARLSSRRLPGMTQRADLQIGARIVMAELQNSLAVIVRLQPPRNHASR
jgi:hypothetical protein